MAENQRSFCQMARRDGESGIVREGEMSKPDAGEWAESIVDRFMETAIMAAITESLIEQNAPDSVSIYPIMDKVIAALERLAESCGASGGEERLSLSTNGLTRLRMHFSEIPKSGDAGILSKATWY